MVDDESFGVIPVRRLEDTLQILLVQARKGHWGLPKGHAESGESQIVAAERELQEETGLRVSAWWNAPPIQEHYHFELQGQRVSKRVTYWIADVEGDLVLQEAEIQNAEWLSMDAAIARMTFDEGREVLKQVRTVLDSSRH